MRFVILAELHFCLCFASRIWCADEEPVRLSIPEKTEKKRIDFLKERKKRKKKKKYTLDLDTDELCNREL